MDQFARQGSVANRFGSQAPQSTPQPTQGSREGSSFPQGQPSQGPNSFSHGSGSQPGPQFVQAPGPQSEPSYGQRPVQSQGQLQNNQDNRRSLGGQGPQQVLGGKLAPGDQRQPSVSRRLYIKWSMVTHGGSDEEDTETLVLTEPQSGLFVDVRLLKSTLRQVSPGNHAQLEPEKIDWAFAGNTISTNLGPDKHPYHRQVVFKHWIDSRSLNPEEIVDNAYMFRATDGTDDEIEVGSMVNPHTGDKQGYEERWTEEDVFPAAGQNDRLCIVMTTEQSDGTRGSVIVLGQWSQGVMRTGQGTLHIERWLSDASASARSRTPAPQGSANHNIYPSPQLSTVGVSEDKNEGWQLIARVGVPILPSPASFINQDLSEGMICSVSGMQWRVRAVRRW